MAISLLVHAVLLFGYRLSNPPAREQARREMTVWLQPAQPPTRKTLTLAPEPEPRRAAAPRPRSQAAPARDLAARAIAVRTRPPAQPEAATPAAPAAPAAPQAITPAPDPLYPDQQAKQFNMDEALKTARSVAKEKAAPGTLAAQLDAHPLYPEDHQTQLQKGVASAKKSDCLRTGAGASLLAPLLWALDKHCKF